MPAFIDMRCVACGRKYGYLGEIRDAKCPHCGSVPTGLTDLQSQIQQAMAEMDKQFKKRMEDRTPEEMEAYVKGQEAFKEGAKITDHTKFNPYEDTNMRRWFILGWNNKAMA